MKKSINLKKIIEIIELNHSVKILNLEEINDRVFLITANESKLILKLNTTTGDAKISERILELFNFPFKNELKINNSLNSMNILSFKYPRMLFTDQKSYMIFEYIKGGLSNYNTIPHKFKKKFLLEYYKFLSLAEIGLKPHGGKLTTLLRNHNILILRVIFGKLINLNLLLFYNIVIISVKSNIKQKKIQKKFLLHGDLNKNQNYINVNNNIYFIDFASVKLSSKWIFVDILTFIYDKNTNLLNLKLLKEYIYLLDFNENQISLKEQLLISYIINYHHCMTLSNIRAFEETINNIT